MSRIVIITGAAKGIGRGIALKCAKEGDSIVLNYRSTLSDELVQEIEACGVECFPFQADVSDFAQAEKLVKAAKERFGRIDVLVNNAGITRDGLIMRMSEQDFMDVLDANLKSAFNMIRHASGIMLKQRAGAIVNLSSIVGVGGNAGQANYSASKAGVIGLTKSAAKEFGKRGITVNAVAPGFIETDMTAQLSEEVRKKYFEKIALGRYGTIDEVADLVYYLSTNKYITGQTVCIDGGM